MMPPPRARYLLGLPARAVVATARLGSRFRSALSSVALLLTLVVGTAYLVFGALGVDPTAETMTVRVHLAQSGGLLTGQNVTLRGVPIGQVASIELTPTGLVATAAIDAKARVPADGEVRVASLSLAGEQYLDFRPVGDRAPYLTDGAEIEVERTSTPVPLWQTLAQLDTTLAQVDPVRLAAIVEELGVSEQGPRKLADIVDGGIFLISTLDSVLPQTVGLLREGRTVLTTAADAAPGLGEFAGDTAQLMAGVEAKSGGFVDLLGAAPGTLGALDAVLAQNSTGVVDLLGNLGTVADMANSRVPALREFFFPTERAGSTLGNLTAAFHDGGLWGLVNLYPRYSCDYDLPRRPPSRPDFPEPYLYTYCANEDPSVLVRGARNAPRPPGSRIPGAPPPGQAADTQAIPTPLGPWTIPLTFAGPELPTPVPR
ncbi:MCE family protein [Nocardia fluminea]|uniref:Virulence factor Mce-like protein n=1 Tax=Nocardia fluminea TaxID=134984 RepID=A0A2N3VKJ2_9NOCA|nr:MCE family protein [Nocardia fluminea]PKV82135.1 virulence factor Mce-like protein [Nocardia fluminea]